MSIFFFQLKWQMSVGDVIGHGCGLEAIYLVVHGPKLRLAGEFGSHLSGAASFHSECTRDGSSLYSFCAICTGFQRRLTSLEPMPLPLLFLLFARAGAASEHSWIISDCEANLWNKWGHSVRQQRWERGQALEKHFGFIPSRLFSAVNCMYGKSQPKQTSAGTSSVTSSVVDGGVWVEGIVVTDLGRPLLGDFILKGQSGFRFFFLCFLELLMFEKGIG